MLPRFTSGPLSFRAVIVFSDPGHLVSPQVKQLRWEAQACPGLHLRPCGCRRHGLGAMDTAMCEVMGTAHCNTV